VAGSFIRVTGKESADFAAEIKLFSSRITGNEVTAGLIMAELTMAIDETQDTAQFNVVRARVWEGGKRGFLRKNYSSKCQLSIKFMDDIEQSKGAVD